MTGSQHMRNWIWAAAVCWAATAGPAAASPELLDRIIAVVDDEAILWSDLNYRLQMDIEQGNSYDYLLNEDKLKAKRAEILEGMIDEQVLIRKAKQDSLQIDEGQVETLLNERYGMIKRDLQPAELQQMLKQAGLTERQLKMRYRKDIRHNLLYEAQLRKVAMGLFVTRKDVEAYRETHRDTLPQRISISQINVKLKPDEGVLQRVREKIESIEKKLEAGEDFADLARRVSEDPATASQGGNLGCFGTGLLFPQFEAAAFRLKPGEISQPVLTERGYHLILLHEKREDELCASHILANAPLDSGDKRRAKEQLEELRRRALAGEEFSQLARNHSEDPETALRGGLWSVVPKGQVQPFLQPYINRLKLGEVSEPFFLEDGGHIIKINDDFAILETLLREERIYTVMRQVIDDYKQEIHVDNRIDQAALQPTVYGAP